MTDLEMTKLCAEAMGYGLLSENYDPRQGFAAVMPGKGHGLWHPLHDDAQAMALVKKFELHFHPPVPNAARDWWVHTNEWQDGREAPRFGGTDMDLNRAIVECVAKMQSAKVVGTSN